ncbi:hypothetical protein J4E91_002579 [Alternaria rosae]|nr:hypothetical protein J4E91_002579 [Alternaria rosae]
MGAICFMDIPFGAVDWKPDLGSPFKNCEDSDDTPGALHGDARDFSKQYNDRVYFDRGQEADWISFVQLKCLILGMQDISDGRLMTHYGKSSGVYERVGVAVFERDQTWMDQEHIQRIRVI